MKYYIGVDGGGTKTAFALFDESKKMLAFHEGPGSNHENLATGFQGASEIIMQGIETLCNKSGLKKDAIAFTLMGLAGIDHPYQHDAMCELLKDKGLKNFEIFNDGFIVIKAGSQTGRAIGYNCGTGVCCNGIDKNGTMLQLMGLGYFSGDISGGENIVTTAFSFIYDELFLGLEKTLLTDMVMKEYGFNDKKEVLTLIEKYESEDCRQYIRQMIAFFFEAAKAGDKRCLEYCEKMAQRGACSIAAVARELQFDGDEIEVVLSGSINVKLDNKVYLDMLKTLAQEKCGRKLKFIKLTDLPVTGCVNWILQDYQ
ncbi:MAG: hypothetical protein K6B52_07770 [Clostridiales bacterium]|nr:hypothetical protein [Clostridiales bacterium]